MPRIQMMEKNLLNDLCQRFVLTFNISYLPDSYMTNKDTTTTGTGHLTTTTAALTTHSTTTVTTTCPPNPINIETLGCKAAEIVIMIEHSHYENQRDVKDEGDIIQHLANNWKIGPNRVRVGVVPYHNTATDAIRITDNLSSGDLFREGNDLTRHLSASGSANLAKAFDFVRDNSFMGARHGIPKVVVVLINALDNNRGELLAAARRLKEDCVNIITLFIAQHSPENDQLVQQIASQPNYLFYKKYNSYQNLEDKTFSGDFKC